MISRVSKGRRAGYQTEGEEWGLPLAQNLGNVSAEVLMPSDFLEWGNGR